MSSSAVRYLVLLCSLVATSDAFFTAPIASSTPYAAPGLTYTSCGLQNMCRDQSNVTCRQGTCKCSPGYIGNGNIACADPGDSCLCTMARDPHVVTSTGRHFRLPIPCAHTIAEFSTPSAGGFGQCNVWIIGLAYNPKFNNSLNFYERQVDLRVEDSAGYEFTARIISGQDAIVGGNWPYNPLSTSNGNTLITILECDLEIAYRSDGSFFSLRTSRAASGEGICDNCQDYGINPPARTDDLDILFDQLSFLTLISPFDNFDINRFEFCVTLYEMFTFFPPNRWDAAVQLCGGFIVDRRFDTCLQRITGNAVNGMAARVNEFDQCMQLASFTGQPCSSFENLFLSFGCPRDSLSVLNTDGFCVRR